MRRRFSGIGRRSRIRFVGPGDLPSEGATVPPGSEAEDHQSLARKDGQQEGTASDASPEGSGQHVELTEDEIDMRKAMDRFGAESSTHGYERHMLERE